MNDTDMELNFGPSIPKADEGTYPGICVGIVPFTINEDTNDQKTLLRWEAQLTGVPDLDEAGEPDVIVDGVTSLATGERSKMRPWVRALAGSDPTVKVSLSELRAICVGKPCLVQVIHKDGWAKIGAILPPLKASTRLVGGSGRPVPTQAHDDSPLVSDKASGAVPDELPFR